MHQAQQCSSVSKNNDQRATVDAEFNQESCSLFFDSVSSSSETYKSHQEKSTKQ